MRKEYSIDELTLKDLRVLNEKSQLEMAKMLNLSETGYRKKEYGSSVSFQEGAKLMEIYDLTFDEMLKILTNTQNKNKKTK